MAVEADAARSGTSDSAVSTIAVVRNADRRRMKRASRKPTPVKNRVSWAKPASGMALPSISRGTSIARGGDGDGGGGNRSGDAGGEAGAPDGRTGRGGRGGGGTG